MYARVSLIAQKAEVLKRRADALMVKHAKPPCPLFDGIEEERK
jgi:hypothetical protein